MRQARAYAKINLALVVGPLRDDGKHEVVTVLQRIDLHDDVALASADELVVEGFAGDTIVQRALEVLARAADVEPRWRVHIEKRIPVAAGLGGGSADAAAALLLANALVPRPLPPERLHAIAAELGADVPFFLREGPQLGTGAGTELSPVALPGDYHVVVVLPHGVTKASTAAVYAAFDARGGAAGFDERAAAVRHALASIDAVCDLAALPANDLGSSPLAQQLSSLGALRADVSGAGPAVYGLFEQREEAQRAAEALAAAGRTLVSRPVAR
jgi:4-diphosphocytidyl-2-C-methyl-D-erythritol kinase